MPRSSDRLAPSGPESAIAAREPRATLHTNRWKEASARAVELQKTKAGAVWTRLLAHQERGWEYVRPLACVAEEAKRLTTGPHLTAAIYQFIDVEVVDLYRYNAFQCADLVLGPSSTDWFPSTDDIDAETDAFYRNVSLLRLASAHPLAPPEIRSVAGRLGGLDGWYAEFGEIFAPAAEAFNRASRRIGRQQG